jgi:four helix bundle protein
MRSQAKLGNEKKIRGAGASIAAPNAEGCGRGGDAELAGFLQMARGSTGELQYHLMLAYDLGLLTVSDYNQFDRKTGEVKHVGCAPRPLQRISEFMVRSAHPTSF